MCDHVPAQRRSLHTARVTGGVGARGDRRSAGDVSAVGRVGGWRFCVGVTGVTDFWGEFYRLEYRARVGL